jgi:predicted RNA-binding Zn-ribbon protein involved in translation (DUF1610 family)
VVENWNGNTLNGPDARNFLSGNTKPFLRSITGTPVRWLVKLWLSEYHNSVMSDGNPYGFLCPNCDKGTDLLVRTTADIHLRPHGMELDDAKLMDSTHVDCLNCGWAGTVGDLLQDSLKKEPGSERNITSDLLCWNND